MKRQGGIRAMRGKPIARPAGQAVLRHQPTAVGTSMARAQLTAMVGRLAAEDPARARAFLMLLREAVRTGRRSAVSSVLAAFGGLGTTIAEAARPTPLKTRPANLADSWNAVGRSIGASMIGFGEQHDRHAG